MTPRQESWQGMNWIRQEKRLAIYLRDGLACCYCGDEVAKGAQLTLDHIRPHKKGQWKGKGENEATNLVTACSRCNSARGSKTIPAFARYVATNIDRRRNPDNIVAHVRACSRRALPKAEAKAMVARQGSAAKAMAKLAKAR